MAVTDGADSDGDIPEMIEEVWDGEGSWLGRAQVARSPAPDGDVIFTLPPQALVGDSPSGDRDVVVPLALLRWVIAR